MTVSLIGKFPSRMTSVCFSAAESRTDDSTKGRSHRKAAKIPDPCRQNPGSAQHRKRPFSGSPHFLCLPQAGFRHQYAGTILSCRPCRSDEKSRDYAPTGSRHYNPPECHRLADSQRSCNKKVLRIRPFQCTLERQPKNRHRRKNPRKERSQPGIKSLPTDPVNQFPSGNAVRSEAEEQQNPPECRRKYKENRQYSLSYSSCPPSFTKSFRHSPGKPEGREKENDYCKHTDSRTNARKARTQALRKKRKGLHKKISNL